MSEKIGRHLFWIPIIASVLTIGAVMFWAPVCAGKLELANGSQAPMRCWYMGRAAVLISVIIIAFAIEQRVRRQIMFFGYLTAGIIFMFLPLSGVGIGCCVKEGMACQTTALWIRAAGILCLLSGIIGAFVRGASEVEDE